jgi:hypothetical protein
MAPVPPSGTAAIRSTTAAPVQVSDSSDHSEGEDGSSHGDGHSSISYNTSGNSSSSLRPYFEPPHHHHGGFELGSHGSGSSSSGTYYNRYPPFSTRAVVTEQQPSGSFDYREAPLSPMVNSLAAATFGVGSPMALSPQRAGFTSSAGNVMMMPSAADDVSASQASLGFHHQSPVEAAAAAIFPSPSDGSDDMLDSIVDDLFFDGANHQGRHGSTDQQQALDEELVHFVHSFDPDLSSVLGSGQSNDITDFELGTLLDKMLDQ